MADEENQRGRGGRGRGGRGSRGGSERGKGRGGIGGEASSPRTPRGERGGKTSPSREKRGEREAGGTPHSEAGTDSGKRRGRGRGGRSRGRGGEGSGEKRSEGRGKRGRGGDTPGEGGRGSPARSRGTSGRGGRGRGTPNRKNGGGEEGGKGSQPKSLGSTRRKRQVYEEYLTREEADAGMAAGVLFSGKLRINARKVTEAYVTVPGLERDIAVIGVDNRNRAFDGDVVVVEFLEPDDGRGKRGKKSKQAAAPAVAEEESSEEEEEHTSGEDVARALDFADKKSGAAPDAEGALADQLARLQLAAQADKWAALTTGEEAAGPRPAAEGDGEEEGEEEDEEEEGEGAPRVEAEGEEPDAQDGDVLENEVPVVMDAEGDVENIDAMKEPAPVIPHPGQAPRAPALRMNQQRQGKVVFVLQENRPAVIAGFLRSPRPDGSMKETDTSMLLQPLDKRQPRMLVHLDQPFIPEDIRTNTNAYKATMFSAKIGKWGAGVRYPHCRLTGMLGDAGRIDADTAAILLNNNVDYSEFDDEVIKCLQPFRPWRISPEEVAKRRDFRGDRVFSIDPPTARDLDDALSIVPLPDGNFRVGVHIADVASFVLPRTALDESARSRATSVYLVQKVIPMLPRLLCEELCSLNPGEDRYAFSVEWVLTPDGDIVGEPWFGRSVIRSCVKLSYDHAQKMLEGTITDRSDEFAVHNGVTVSELTNDVLLLNRIAVKLRAGRFANGALSLNKMKLLFDLDKETGDPTSWHVYQQKDANRLVEEYMLLANMTVARQIQRVYPDASMLRRHPKPNQDKLDDMVKVAKDNGIELDGSTAASLQVSLEKIRDAGDIYSAVMMLLVTPMQQAVYFCTGNFPEAEFRHYALNVPFYTHFTSPIRRYPDVVVHRLLAASLEADPHSPETLYKHGLMSTEECAATAEHCNTKKKAAKDTQDASAKSFFCVLLRRSPMRGMRGVVCGVGQKSFTIVVPEIGFDKRIYVEDLNLASHTWDEKNQALTLVWPSGGSTIVAMFRAVTVNLAVHPTKIPQDITLDMAPDA